MKIRIKGNSVRIRLTKSEVSSLAATGYLEEQTKFANGSFIYCLQSSEAVDVLSATFNNNKITVMAPASFVKEWPQNEIIGINSNMPINENETLYLLLEKDFVCLDETTEDQSDNFENPNKTC